MDKLAENELPLIDAPAAATGCEAQRRLRTSLTLRLIDSQLPQADFVLLFFSFLFFSNNLHSSVELAEFLPLPCLLFKSRPCGPERGDKS